MYNGIFTNSLPNRLQQTNSLTLFGHKAAQTMEGRERLTGITAAGNSCLLRSPSSAAGRLWLTGLPEERQEKKGEDRLHNNN